MDIRAKNKVGILTWLRGENARKKERYFNFQVSAGISKDVWMETGRRKALDKIDDDPFKRSF